MPEPRRVAVVTLGCARNEVDSEELAARLAEVTASEGQQVPASGAVQGQVEVGKAMKAHGH